MTPEVQQAADSLLHQIAVIRFNQHDSDEVEQSWCAQVETILAALETAHRDTERVDELQRLVAANAMLHEVAIYLRRTIRALSKHEPDSKLTKDAVEYLRCTGLTNPIRDQL